MSSQQRKFISLQEAAEISGYTAAELKNLIKIGLIPCRKQKNKIFVRYDAFAGFNQTEPAKPQSSKNARVLNSAKALPAVRKPMNLVPFTKPHLFATRVLEPVAFAAVLAMTMYVGMMPPVAEGVLDGIGVAEQTLAFMGQSTQELTVAAVIVPMAVNEQLAMLVPPSMLRPSAVAMEVTGGQVAGVMVGVDAVVSSSGQSQNVVESILIGIADASDQFQRNLSDMDAKVNQFIFGSLTFDKLDSTIQQTFHW